MIGLPGCYLQDGLLQGRPGSPPGPHHRRVGGQELQVLLEEAELCDAMAQRVGSPASSF